MERTVQATTKVRAGVDRVRGLLRDVPSSVFGEPEQDPRRFVPHRFRTTVPARLGPDATVEESVVLEIGPVPGEGRPLEVDVTWEPAGHQRVVPSFSGVLRVDPTDDGGSELTVRGTYAAPLGAVGRFGDTVIGSRVARTSIEETTQRLGRRMSAAVHGQEEDRSPRTPRQT